MLAVAVQYYLAVGKTPGAADYSGAFVGLSLSQTVNNLPVNGSMVYVRLYTRLSAGWAGNYQDFGFKAATH